MAPAVLATPRGPDQEELLLIETESSATAHPTTLTIERIAEAVEQELARLRRARPALASRISRAESIIVTHLSCRRARVIRVRVAGDGRARFLVSGSGGAVYVVDPARSWSCTCPDYHRRGAGCKHSIACWALRRASARPALAVEGFEHVGEIVGGAPALRQCAGCGERFTGRELVEVGPQEAEWTLAVSEGERLCHPCARRHGVL